MQELEGILWIPNQNKIIGNLTITYENKYFIGNKSKYKKEKNSKSNSKND